MQTSAAGTALALQTGAVPSPYESEEERKKRLASLQASQSSINRNLGGVSTLSAAGKYLAGGLGGGV